MFSFLFFSANNPIVIEDFGKIFKDLVKLFFLDLKTFLHKIFIPLNTV